MKRQHGLHKKPCDHYFPNAIAVMKTSKNVSKILATFVTVVFSKILAAFTIVDKPVISLVIFLQALSKCFSKNYPMIRIFFLV